jgi:hypothetical protein
MDNNEDVKPFVPRRSWRKLARAGLWMVLAGSVFAVFILIFGGDG